MNKEVIRLYYDYSKLRGRIVEKYGTITAFTKAIKCSNVTVSRKLNGATSFSQEDVELWGDALGIAPQEYGLYFFTRKV